MLALALAVGVVALGRTGTSLEAPAGTPADRSSQPDLARATPAPTLGDPALGRSSVPPPADVPVVRTELWRTAVLDPPVAPPAVHGGRVYAAGAGGHVLALDLATGERVWSSNVRALGLEPVAISVAEGRVVTTWESGLIATFSTDRGRFAWHHTLPTPIEPPTIVDRTVVVLTLGETGGGPAVHTFSLDDGRVGAAVGLASTPARAAVRVGRAVLLCDTAGGLTLLSLPELDVRWSAEVGSADCTYDPSSGRAIWAAPGRAGVVDATTGATDDLGSRALPTGVEVSVSVTDHGFLVASDRAVVALDPAGEELWRRGLDGDVLIDPTTMATSGGGIHAADPTGTYLNELSALAGEVAGRSAVLAAPLAHPPVGFGDTVVLVHVDGTVSALARLP